ncbi:uncharacterized protein EKO05_0008703 [Ascochyta rabiei]|uniref:uncharacterized protein n=1 Tax=Didymella rabiei TaxID=5454 RepID=UPI0021FC606A|nr:uncharacterized protein EKO05_0008703 [Ascochyta rabiei]UPX18401.1 hypothetical protein EKO05_0008703 [Ascochyta rabiei]
MNTYAKDATYNPTTHPQPEGTTSRFSPESSKASTWHMVHLLETSKRFGFTTFKSGGRFDHPLSPTGLKSNPNVFPEFTDTRPDYPGYFHPPMEYTPGQMSWQYHDTWQAALATAMLAKGVKFKGEEVPISVRDIQIFSEKVVEKDVYKAETSHILHHPADRDTAIFKDEPSASTIARWAAATPFSLVIVCPVIQADGVGWNRIWDTHNRPPIRSRWSVKSTHEAHDVFQKRAFANNRNWLNKDVHWFTMDPIPKTKFYDFWNASMNFSNELPQIISKVGLQGMPQGPWIWQFGLHVKSIGSPWKPKPFTFDPKKLNDYKGLSITYRLLTAWITNWKFTGGIRLYAQIWDDAIAALVNYNHNKTDEKWEKFREKMHKAKTPFW